MKKTVILIISLLLLIGPIGTYLYMNHQNNEIIKEIEVSKKNVKKLEDTINSEKKVIDEKEDEYEKLKDKVKESIEEVGIWESIKEELNKALS